MGLIWATIGVLESTLFCGGAFIALPYLYLKFHYRLLWTSSDFKSIILSMVDQGTEMQLCTAKQIMHYAYMTMAFLFSSLMSSSCTDYLPCPPNRMQWMKPTSCHCLSITISTACAPVTLLHASNPPLPPPPPPAQPINRSVIAPSLPWQCQGSTL